MFCLSAFGAVNQYNRMRQINRQFIASAIGLDGLATFLFSNLVLVATLGVIYLYLLVRTSKVAITSPCRVTGTSDMALVLGYRLDDSGQLHEIFRQRLDRAIDYCYRNSDARICLLGGETLPGFLSEARAGLEYLRKAKMCDAVIELEEQSRHTLENLHHFRHHTDGYLKLHLHIITSRFHLARSMTLAKGLGLNVEPLAAEERFDLSIGQLFKLLKEAYLLHWYHVGKRWSILTGNSNSLERIR